MSTAGAPAPAVRILVVEDDPEIQYLLSRVLLEPDREIFLAGTAAEGERLLASGEFHLLVLDLLLPDADGRTLLRSLRAKLATAVLPVIVLTSRGGPELRAECYEIGADAFVTKPFDPEVLASDVSSRLERATARLRQSHLDPLTGFLNLAGLVREIETTNGQARALVMAELDGLRTISGRHGWGTAEMLVHEVARALRGALPDLALARPESGEYGVVVPGEDAARAAAVASTLLETVRGVPLKGADGETFRLTASAAFQLDGGASEPTDLLEAVRSMVHRARELGGNRTWAPAEEARADAGPPLVLVAEDDDITAKILVHRLERDALQVVRCDNGQDAYREALSRTPALVILDVKMPGMDGFEVLERLRKTPSYATIPIMMLTSMGSEADVVRGFELGADDYILKPFSPTELLARIRRLLRRGRETA